jgi:zinc finger protein 830
MSDVRALLKAKRRETRIQHPYASYTSTGQLRCAACEMVIKLASAWAGHVGSKSHRENVRKISQIADQEGTSIFTGKRKVEPDDPTDGDEVHSTSEPKKRKVTPDSPPKPTLGNTSAFPSDFFSDPSRALVDSANGDSSDEAEDNYTPVPQGEISNPIDLEWQRFQQEILTSSPTPVGQRHETFKHATVFAEPELLPENVLGLPIRELPHADVVEAEVPKNEEESRKRKDEDEKQLIIDRLLEEERAQEEADAKVVLLKGRLDALKKRRNEAKAARAQKPQ